MFSDALFINCEHEATHYCVSECGFQCESCQLKSHPLGSNHNHHSIVEQQNKQQLALESQAANLIIGYDACMQSLKQMDAKLKDQNEISAREKNKAGQLQRRMKSI